MPLSTRNQRPTQPPTGGGLSWWLLPLRGGHGRGLRRFAAVMAEVFAPSWWSRRRSFLHRHKNNAKNASHATSAFLSQEPAWGLRLFAALAPPGEIFGEIIVKEEEKTSRKSHLHWPWAVVMWRSSPRRLGGHGGLLRTRPVVFLGGLSWFFNLAVKTP